MSMIITGVDRESDVSVRPGKHGNILEFTEHYTVQTTDIEANQSDVIAGAVTNADTIGHLPGGVLPLPQVTFSVDGYATCRTLNGRRLGENPRIWKFTSTWSSEVKEGNSTDLNVEDVTTIVPVRKTMFDTVKRYRTKDYGGQPYVNGAGDLYSPALEVEEEIRRWEFTQVEPVHSGSGAGIVTKTEPTVVDVSGSAKVRPPGIYQDSTLAVLIGVTDDTIDYFNGSINSHIFRWKAPFTLKLSVRDSYTTKAYGKSCRITDYAISYDPLRWFDKPINAGPYFLAPKLDSSGTPVGGGVLSKYEYIYFTKDVEDKDTILSQDENGPLGKFASPGPASDVRFYNNATDAAAAGTAKPISFDPAISSSSSPFIWTRQFAVEDGKPLGDYVLVTGANGKKTYRANRPDITARWNHIERLNSFVFDFGDYLRVR